MLSDWGHGLQDFGSFPDDDREPTNTLPDDCCPTCGQWGCVGYCDCPEEEEAMIEQALADYQRSQDRTVYLCTVCKQNSVDPYVGEDTCADCIARQ